MSREWKPGDVALLADKYGWRGVGLCFKGGVDDGDLDQRARWQTERGDAVWSSVASARPLVVIDPEDEHGRAAVEITQAIGTAMNHQPGADLSHIRRAVNRALRSLITPPKPDEPTGLGAVVEDAEGFRYVKGYADGESTHPWHVIDPAARKSLGWWRYDKIAAVRVLSEGVQA